MNILHKENTPSFSHKLSLSSLSARKHLFFAALISLSSENAKSRNRIEKIPGKVWWKCQVVGFVVNLIDFVIQIKDLIRK